MTINYTTLLGLAEPVTGTESGTWGDDVNKGITDYLDIAIAGTQTISGSQTAVTLSVTNGSSAANNIAQVGSGATGSSQYQIINCTGSPASLLTITAPASSKTYVIINATSTSQSVKIVGTGPTTGVTVASGDKAFVAWNGTDFVRVNAAIGGSNTQVQYNSSGNLAGSANMTFDGTKLTVANILDSGLTASKPVFTDASKNLVSTGTLGTDQGGTNLTSFTSGGAVYATSTSVLTTGTLPNTAGGTGQSSAFTQYGVVYASTTSALATTGAGTAGYVLTANSGSAPTFKQFLLVCLYPLTILGQAHRPLTAPPAFLVLFYLILLKQ
jgi:hypothetical protein